MYGIITGEELKLIDEFICEMNGYYVEAYGVTHWMPLPEEPKE